MFCAQLARHALDQITDTTAERKQQRDFQQQSANPGQWRPEYHASHARANAAFRRLQAFSGAALCTLDGPLGTLGLFRAVQTQLVMWRSSPQPASRLVRDVIPAAQLSTRLHQELFPHSWAA